jgi:hypothetical protein
MITVQKRGKREQEEVTVQSKSEREEVRRCRSYFPSVDGRVRPSGGSPSKSLSR